MVAKPRVIQQPGIDIEKEPEPLMYTLDDVRAAIFGEIEKSDDGVVKQSVVKKEFALAYRIADPEALQGSIDTLCEQRVFEKTRRGGMTWLMAADPTRLPTANTETRKEPSRKNEINPAIAASILQVLAGSGVHPHQRFEITDIWRSMGNSGKIPQNVASAIRQQCRALAKLNLVELNQAKRRGSGPSSRSSTHEVFKVGIASAEVKRVVATVLADKTERALLALFENGPIELS